MMKYKGYMGKVEFDDEAKVLHGEVVGLRDVVTFQADSVEAIEPAFRDSVDDYLAFCAERGEEPERPFSGQFVVRTDSELHRVLNMLAQVLGKSLNSLVVEFLHREAENALANLRAAAREPGRAAPKRAGPRQPGGSRSAAPHATGTISGQARHPAKSGSTRRQSRRKNAVRA